MGTTVLYGSGDDGVAGTNGTCLGPRGQWDPWLYSWKCLMAAFLYRSPRCSRIQPPFSSNMSFRCCRWGNTDQSELDSVRAGERLRAKGLQRWWV
jgi:hypothetical protein